MYSPQHRESRGRRRGRNSDDDDGGGIVGWKGFCGTDCGWRATAKGNDPAKGGRKQRGPLFGCALDVTIGQSGQNNDFGILRALWKISRVVYLPSSGASEISYATSNIQISQSTPNISLAATWPVSDSSRPRPTLNKTHEANEIILCRAISSILLSKCTGGGVRVREGDTYARKRKSYVERDIFLTSHSFSCSLHTKKWHGKEMLHAKLSPCLRRCRETSTVEFFFPPSHSSLKIWKSHRTFYRRRRIKAHHFNQQSSRCYSLKFYSGNLTHLLNFKLY